MGKILLLLATLFLLTTSSFAQTPSSISEPKVVRIFYENRNQLNFLSLKGFDLFEAATNEYVEALVTSFQYQYLLNRGFRIEVLPGEFTINAPFDPSCYTTYQNLVMKLQNVNGQYPNLTELIDVGDSWEKTQGGSDRDLWVMRLTNEQKTESKPKLFLVSEHHARELATVEVLLKFVDYLTQNYGTDQEVTDILDTREVWVMPMANPDGHVKAENGQNWRKNTNNSNGCSGGSPPESYGTDTNRNYDTGWGQGGSSSSSCAATYRGLAGGSESEVDGIKKLAEKENFNLLISYHSYSQLVLFPWGCSALGSQTAHHQQFQVIAAKLSELTKINPQDAPYRYGQPQDILYSACGTTDDWFYQTFQKPAFTFEIGTTFWPSCQSLETIWQRNLKPMLYAAKISDDPWNVSLTPTPSLTPIVSPTPPSTPMPTLSVTPTPSGIVPSPTTLTPSPTLCQNVDLNSDGSVDGSDLQILLTNYGNRQNLMGDVNTDGQVNGVDAVVLISCWGK